MPVNRPVRIVAFLAVIQLASAVVAEPVAGIWSEEFYLNGPENAPSCVEAHDGRVVIGGSFSTAGRAVAANLAWYDEDGWHAFAAGPAHGVKSLFPHDGRLTAMTSWSPYGGEVDTTQIWTLDGNVWQLTAELVTPLYEHAAISFQGDVYAGGWRWNGSEFTPAMTCDDDVRDLAVLDDLLVFAGDFTIANGDTVGSVAAWNGNEVVRPWPVSNDRVDKVTVHDGAVWIMAGYGYSLRVKRWAGGEWETKLYLFGDQLSGPLYGEGLFVVDGQLYVSYRGYSNWIYAEKLLRWDAADESFVDVADLPTRDGAIWGDGLVVAHRPPALPSLALHTVCYLKGRPPTGDIVLLDDRGLGFTASVVDLSAGDGLAVGGSFHHGAGLHANIVVRDDEGTWTAAPFVGGWPPATVTSVGLWNDELYVSGVEHQGCIDEPGVYRRVGDAWNLLHQPDLAQLTAVPGSGLYGYNWRTVRRVGSGATVGTCTDGYLRALARWNDQLVAGGSFTALGGAGQGALALYTGYGWVDVGDTLRGGITALGSWQEQLVVAGALTFPGQDGKQIALWNGSSWQALPGLFDDDVRAVCQYRDLLVVGGDFEQVDDLDAAHVATWDGNQWAALGSGCDRSVRTLAVHDDRLWLGGQFHIAGGVPAHGLTWWRAVDATGVKETPTAATTLTVFPNPCNPAATIRFSLPFASHVALDIHDLAGRRVVRLLDGQRPVGRHHVTWRGRDDRGRALASGVYLVRLAVGSRVESQRVVLLQ